MTLSRRLTIAAFILVFCSMAAPQIASAQQQYLEDAITETREAVAAGKQSLPGSFVDHAAQAVDKARSAVWQNPVERIRRGIKYLRKAIKIAKGTSSDRRLDKATEQAEAALTQFESAR